jgi:acetyltransferase-like isoleucine patch superfamily enzyme
MRSVSAAISENSKIHTTASIWSFAEIREKAVIGAESTIGSKVYIGTGVVIGSFCKIQNNSLVYEPAIIEDGVFIGPSVVLTNDKNPRAINLDGTLKKASDWTPVGVHIKYGASIGAGATCVAPLIVGSWAMISAGSVVINNVADFELVGGVPAKHLGWVGRAGYKLESKNGEDFTCPITKEIYKLNSSAKISLVSE